MKKLIIIIPVALLLILLLVAAYFGFVPGASSLFVKQVDLGVTSDPELVVQMHEETGFVDKLDVQTPTSEELNLTGTLEIEREFTNGEITSVINDVVSKWTLAPYRNVQVDIKENGEAHVSGIISIPKMIERAKVFGYTQEQIDAAGKYIGVLPDEIPVYGVVTGKVENNEITIDLKQGKIGNFPIPSKYLELANTALLDIANKKLAMLPTVNIQKLEAKDGNVSVDGTFHSELGE